MLLVMCAILFSGCIHDHVWLDATCTEPAKCEKCGKTDGEPLGHSWQDATCTQPKTCTVCGATEGDPLNHDWIEATHDAPKTCARCGETEGTVLLYDIPPGWKTDYEPAEYERFNSPAKENGLGGTMVWVSGSFETVSTYDLSDVQSGLVAYTTFLTDENGNEWVINIDLNIYADIEKYAELVNHPICLCGRYDGWSGLYERPIIYVEKLFDRVTGNIIRPQWYTEAF